MRKASIVGAVVMCLRLCSVTNAASSVTAIAAGGAFNLELAADGTVWAWGSNDLGQLGDGTTTTRLAPVQVAGLGGVVAISAGFAHSLAVKNDGTVWAWGKNFEGELGDGTTLTRRLPVRVSGLSGVVAVAGGAAHSLALKSDGTVWAWGWSTQTAISRTAPVQLTGLTAVVAIAAGQAHSLAVKSDGTVWAWGNNWYGQLGDGSIAPMAAWSVAPIPDPTPPAPVQVSGLTGVAAIAAGYGHSLALKRDGTVWAWGHNGGGQLGDGTSGNVRPTPVQAGGLTGVAAIAATEYGSLAVKNGGTVWDWGLMGDGTYELTPAQVHGLAGVVAVAAGLALKGDGTVWALGRAAGNGTPAFRVAPGQIGGLTAMAAVAERFDGGLALKKDGTVWQWGSRSTPAQVSGLNGVVAIAAGETQSLALTGDGTAWEWSGQSTPMQVAGLSGVAAIAASWTRGLAVKSDGTVWEWSGQSPPAQVSGLSGVVAVSVVFDWSWGPDGPAGARSLALKSDGTVWAWEKGDRIQSPTPVQMSGLDGIVSIAGGNTSLAVKADGTVWEWDETALVRPAPVQVSGLTGVMAVALGASADSGTVGPHRLAVKRDGTVWAWGYNAYGQLGDGTIASRGAPVQVAALREVAGIGAAGYHSMAVKRDGTAWEWGALGDGTTPSTPVPVIQPGSPDLAIAMSHGGDFTVGDQGVYTLTITNTGLTAPAGTITVTDTLPPGLSYLLGVGDGWSCSAAGEIVTCTNPGPIDPRASSTIALTVRAEPQAWPGVTNLATMTNASDPNLANNTIGDPTEVRQP